MMAEMRQLGSEQETEWPWGPAAKETRTGTGSGQGAGRPHGGVSLRIDPGC